MRARWGTSTAPRQRTRPPAVEGLASPTPILRGLGDTEPHHPRPSSHVVRSPCAHGPLVGRVSALGIAHPGGLSDEGQKMCASQVAKNATRRRCSSR